MNIIAKDMMAACEQATRLLKALANPTRLMFVCQLIDGEKPVGELASMLSIRDSTASQHLAVLRRDGILTTRRDGQTVYYAISDAAVRDVLTVLHRHFCASECLNVRPAQGPRGRPGPRRRAGSGA